MSKILLNRQLVNDICDFLKKLDRTTPDTLAEAMIASVRLLASGNYDRRTLTYRFITLPFRHQIAIANSLNVLTDADREHCALNTDKLCYVVFKRAVENGLIADLWNETEKRWRETHAAARVVSEGFR